MTEAVSGQLPVRGAGIDERSLSTVLKAARTEQVNPAGRRNIDLIVSVK